MKCIRWPQILCVICMLVSLLLLFGPMFILYAEAPMVKTQAPGYYRMMLGQFEITALVDGFIDLDTQLMNNVSETRIKSLLDLNFSSSPKMKTAVNVYLINTGSKLILVDAGAGRMFGPMLGNVMRNIKAARYDPAQVDAVLITHMHGDHVGGLLDAENRPAFSKAFVYVSKAESDFWLSAAEAAKAPAEMNELFDMARDAADPYIALGRWKTFENGDLPISGIKAVPIPGHTAGHCAFEVRSGSDVFLIIGDLVHSMAIQFALPEAAISFDQDQKQAISVRQDLFRRAADSRVLIGGMHIPFPGIGHIRFEGEKGYAWVPIEFSPIP